MDGQEELDREEDLASAVDSSTELPGEFARYQPDGAFESDLPRMDEIAPMASEAPLLSPGEVQEKEKAKTEQVRKVAMLPEPSANGTALADRELNRKWDEFLLRLGQATRVAVWELGINSLTAFRQWSVADLARPKGRLTEAQAREVAVLLAEYGIVMSTKNRLRSDGPRRQRLLPADLPEGATPRDRRAATVRNNRVTM